MTLPFPPAPKKYSKADQNEVRVILMRVFAEIKNRLGIMESE